MKTFKSVYFYFTLLLLNFYLISSPVNAEVEKCDSLNKALLEHGNRFFHFHESRDDIGIFYDFKWNDTNKEIEIKRNDEKYPIVRFSLFDKKNIFPGTVIKFFNETDLSKITDTEIKKLHRSSGTINLRLKNGKIISLNSKPYKLNDFKLTDFILNSIHNIDTAKGILEVLKPLLAR